MKDFGQIKRLKETVVKKDDEMKCLRNVIKNNNSSISKFETENSDLKKTMKREEKDVYNQTFTKWKVFSQQICIFKFPPR